MLASIFLTCRELRGIDHVKSFLNNQVNRKKERKKTMIIIYPKRKKNLQSGSEKIEHIYIYIYMCVCVCVCVCEKKKYERGSK